MQNESDLISISIKLLLIILDEASGKCLQRITVAPLFVSPIDYHSLCTIAQSH